MRLVGQGQVLANMFPKKDKCMARAAAIIAAANHQHNDKQPSPQQTPLKQPAANPNMLQHMTSCCWCCCYT